MKKIEEAAADYVRSPDLDPFHTYADIFIAGARYVLDQLTSDDAVEVLAREFDAEGGLTGEARRRATFIFAAVRKEIEGE